MAHLPVHRCPRRKAALFLMTAASTLSLACSGCMIPGFPDFQRLLILILAGMLLFPAALCDADYCIIPDQTCLLALVTAFLNGLYSSGLYGCGTAAGGGCLCGLMMLLASLLARLVSGKEGIGMGDIKLLTACGALAASASGSGAWAAAACSVYVFSVLSSAVWFSVLLTVHRAQYGDARPLGPWIVLGTLLAIAVW